MGGEGPGIWHVTSADFDPVVAPEGQNVLYTENAVGDAGGVAQVLTDTFAANMDYTLTVEVGNSWEYYYAGYSVQLLAGGVVIAEDNDTLWPEYYKWATSTVEYTYDPADSALVGQPLEIRLLNLALDKDSPPAGEVVGVEFDNVTLSYVPEPITINVPNSDFEEIYKPGSDTITADLGDGWTQGIGPNTPMDDGIATYSDGTTGDSVDIPGWIGADPQGWIDNGGTYDRDTNFPNRQGSVAAQVVTPDGLYYYLSNGGGWGNPAGGLIVSDAPVATVGSGLTYTLSMLATGPDGPATPVVLELLADGVALTPSSSEDPELSGDWHEFSRTYDAASLAGHIGESLTIRLGVDRGASGGQTCFDSVSLSYVP